MKLITILVLLGPILHTASAGADITIRKVLSQARKHGHANIPVFCRWCIEYCFTGRAPPVPSSWAVKWVEPRLSFIQNLESCEDQCTRRIAHWLQEELFGFIHDLTSTAPAPYFMYNPKKRGFLRDQQYEIFYNMLSGAKCDNRGGLGRDRFDPDRPGGRAEEDKAKLTEQDRDILAEFGRASAGLTVSIPEDVENTNRGTGEIEEGQERKEDNARPSSTAVAARNAARFDVGRLSPSVPPATATRMRQSVGTAWKTVSQGAQFIGAAAGTGMGIIGGIGGVLKNVQDWAPILI